MSAALPMTRSNRGFQWYWSGAAASAMGDRVTGFAVPSIAILVLDASGTQVGVLAAMGWLAYPALGVVAGALVTSLPRRGVMVVGELVRFTAFATVPLVAALGYLTVGWLFVVVAVAGVATVFVDIAGFVYLPTLIGPDHLVGANSRLQSTDSLSKLVGPALAGGLMNALGPFTGLLLGSLPFLGSACGRARLPRAAVGSTVRSGSIGHRIRQGLDFVRHHDVLRGLVIASAVRNFGTGAVDAVLLLFAYRALGLSSLTGGLLLAAGAVGAIAGAFAVRGMTARLGVRRVLLVTGLEGLSWLAVPLCLVAPALPLLVAIRVFSSFWMPTWNVVTTSVRQALTPDDRQGTVHAAVRTAMSSTIPLGSVIGGVAGGALSAHLGPAPGLVLVLVAGGACAGLSVALINRVAARL
ncbi:MFS transporter [Umezawaea tangerina]|uniref:Transmembrane secretion effector n=1 Tax=Umezawaea tangerina TaxID=84725 RepID=A0A2T0STI9_9PSEU|nr:MFS transporter [Umezawaea tangerina]PRY36673.1 transmembrane secretion effector [Umezawaea tangerina]